MCGDGQYSVAITVYEHSGTECPNDSCTSCQAPKNANMMVGSAQWCLTVVLAEYVHSFADGACPDSNENKDDNGGNGADGSKDAVNPDDLSNSLNPRSDTYDSADADSTDHNRRRPRDSSWRHAIPPEN